MISGALKLSTHPCHGKKKSLTDAGCLPDDPVGIVCILGTGILVLPPRAHEGRPWAMRRHHRGRGLHRAELCYAEIAAMIPWRDRPILHYAVMASFWPGRSDGRWCSICDRASAARRLVRLFTARYCRNS